MTTGEQMAGEVTALAQSEQFREESGITLDSSGNAANLGGNLGITQSQDGSASVGGENGINVAPSGNRGNRQQAQGQQRQQQ